MNLEELWIDTINKGFDVRKKKEDGLAAWQPLKKRYGQYYFKKANDEIKIKDSFKDIVKKTKYKVKKGDKTHQNVKMVVNGIKLDNHKDTDHFYIQHFRIPIMGDFSLPVVKVLQIAYNAGQVKAEREEQGYPEELNQFYDDNFLGRLDTYVNTVDTIEVQSKDKGEEEVSEMTELMVGGFLMKLVNEDDEEEDTSPVGSGCGCSSLRETSFSKQPSQGSLKETSFSEQPSQNNSLKGGSTHGRFDDEEPGCGCGSLRETGLSKQPSQGSLRDTSFSKQPSLGKNDFVLGKSNKAYLYQRKYMKYKMKYLSLKN